jgi:transposase
MEGCGSCHYCGRLARSYGHRIRIIAPKRVKAFLQGQKTDANDALAIAAAAMQLGVRFCPVKEIDQQALQTLETSRKFLSRDQVALSNHIRAYLYEYGMTIAKGKKSLMEAMALVLEDVNTRLPTSLKATLLTLWERYKLTADQIK